MNTKWILKHNRGHCVIVNEGGKTIGYQPNAGMRIVEADGYAFKDVDGSGHLEAFEDWRLPLRRRAEDFSRRFALKQIDGEIQYRNGKAAMPPEVMRDLRNNIYLEQIIAQEPRQDQTFLQENRLLAALILMLDEGMNDYAIQVLIESARCGLLSSVIYTIANAFRRFNATSAQYALC